MYLFHTIVWNLIVWRDLLACQVTCFRSEGFKGCERELYRYEIDSMLRSICAG